VADSFGKVFAALNGSDANGATDNAQSFANALNNVAGAINAVANAYNKAKKIGGAILDFIEIGDGGLKFADTDLGRALGYTARAAGGPVSAGQAYRVGEFGPETFVPSGSGSIRRDSGGQGVTIIMNGVIDGESARRSIERLLQDSSRRTGAINLVGATL
jgi:SLT domain-containing protein